MQITQKNFYKKFLGRAGENIAKKFLIKKGYEILDVNYKTYVGEIDIIAKFGGVVVFVEVKARSSDICGFPSEAVNKRKQEKYFKVATEYLMKRKLMDSDCRFDVVEIDGDKINHIENAFYG